jgi:uncharacterized membrane protein YeiB
MSELKEILILISLIIVPAGMILFESIFGKWFKETDQVKRDKLSSLWHAIKYWTITLSTLNIFYANHLTSWFIYLPLMMIIYMWLHDFWWNWQHRRTIGSGWLFYPGNGKGGFIEAIIFWLSKRIGLNFSLTMILVKIVILGASVFLIVKCNK